MPDTLPDPNEKQNIDFPYKDLAVDRDESIFWGVVLNEKPSDVHPRLDVIRRELKNENSSFSKRLEDIGNLFKNSYRRGQLSTERSKIKYYNTWQSTPEREAEIARLSSELAKIPESPEADSMFEKLVEGFGGQLDNFLGMLKNASYRGLQGAIAGAGTGAIVGAPTGPGSVITAGGGALLGGIAGFTAGMAEDVMPTIAGGSIENLENMGFDPQHAKYAGTVVGIGGAIVEISGMRLPGSWGVLASRVPGLSKIVEKVGTKYMTKVSTRLQALGRAAKQGLIDFAREEAEEVAQKLLDIGAEEFLALWEDNYEGYRQGMESELGRPISRDEFMSLGERFWIHGKRTWDTAKESAYGVAGLMLPGATLQAGVGVAMPGRRPQQATTDIESQQATPVQEPIEIPDFETSEDPDAFTARPDVGPEVIPELIERRDRWIAQAVKEQKEGKWEDAQRTGFKVQLYNEAIGNLDGTYDSFKLGQSSIEKKKTVVDTMVGILKDQTGAVTALSKFEGMDPKAAIEMRSKLLERRDEILKKAGNDVNRVYDLVKDEGAPAAVADSVRAYIKSELEFPIQHDIDASAQHALKYKGLDNGSEWFRSVELDELIEGESEDMVLRFYALLSQTSRNANPLGNLQNVKRTWKAFKEGREDVTDMGGLVTKKEMQQILYGKDPINWWADLLGMEHGSIKVRDFADTLHLAFKDPELLNEYSQSVQDFRMGQYFYNQDTPPVSYKRERAKRRIIEIRDKLREIDDASFWTADRVQAAIWHWLKDDRIKKGLDPDRETFTFAQAKTRIVANHFGVADEKVTKGMIRSWVKSHLTGNKWEIFDHYTKRGAPWEVLHPEFQGTGKPGREWKSQIKKGERAKVIHLYQGRTDPENQFMQDQKMRVAIKTNRIYDGSKDHLGLRKKHNNDIAAIEKDLMERGYLGLRNGTVVVVYDPVKAYKLSGYNLSLSPSAEDNVIDAAEKAGETETADTLTRIKNLRDAGYEEDIRDYVREDLLVTLDSPLIDLLNLEDAQGRWIGGKELAFDAFVEAGDHFVLRGRFAKFLKRYGQKEGYLSYYAGPGYLKRPEGVQTTQARSFLLHFDKKLDEAQLEILDEVLDRNGIGGSKYVPETRTLMVHHIRKYKQSVKQFEAGVQKALDSATEDTLFQVGIPKPTVSRHWFKHEILEKKNYDRYIEQGTKREKELGFEGIRESFQVDPKSLTEYLQSRGSLADGRVARPPTDFEKAEAQKIANAYESNGAKNTLADINLVDQANRGSKVYHISGDHAKYYFQEFKDENTAIVNTDFRMDGESMEIPAEDLTIYGKTFFEKLLGIIRDESGGIWIESKLLKRLRKKEPDVIELTDVVTPKERIMTAVGQKKLTEYMVTEQEALKASFKKAEQAARKAFIEGRKEGIDLQTVRMEDLKGKQRERIEKMKQTFEDYRQRQRVMKEAGRVRRRVNDMLKRMEKARKKIPKMPDPYKSQIQSFFDAWDTKDLSTKKRLQLEGIQSQLESDPNVDLPERVFEDLKRLSKTSLRDLTVDEFTSIYQAVMHTAALARMQRAIIVGHQTMNIDKYVEGIKTEMKPREDIGQEISDATPSKLKVGRSLNKIWKAVGFRQLNYDTMVEIMAGNNTKLYDVLVRKVKEGGRVRDKYRQAAMDGFWKQLENIGWRKSHGVKNISTWVKGKVQVKDGLTLTRDQRMALYRHSLNTDNWKAITEAGIGFRDAKNLKPDQNIKDGYTDERWVKVLNNTLQSLTPAEIEFAGIPVTSLFDQQGKELAAIFRLINGYELELESNYYPKDTMPLGYSPHDLQTKQEMEDFAQQYSRVGVPKGMLQQRMRVQLPIYLNGLSRDIANSVIKSGNYVGLELPVRNAFRVVTKLKHEIINRYDNDYYREIDKGLRDIIQEVQARDSIDRFMRYMRLHATTATLGVNPWVMMKQAISFPLYWRFVKPRYLAKAMAQWTTSQKAVEERHSIWSPHWTERKGGFNRDIAELLDKKSPKGFFKGKKSIREKSMSGIQWFDKQAVGAGMQAAVLQAQSEFESGKLSEELKGALGIDEQVVKHLGVADKMRLSYEFADWVTSKTQPMFSPEHRSSLSRGGELARIMTMYSSFTNNALNLMVRDFNRMKQNPSKESVQGFAKTMFLLLAVNPAGIMAVNAMRDSWYDREDKKGLFARWLDSVSGYVYFLREVIPSMTSKAVGGYIFGFGTPVSDLIDSVYGTFTELGGWLGSEDPDKRAKAWDKMWEHVIRSAEMLSGVPWTNVKRLPPGTPGAWE